MASFIICNSPLSTFRRNPITTRPQCFIQTPPLRVSGDWYQRRRRGSAVVTRAGPSSTSYIFAFVFPLSLLAITIFTSIRIADKLDKKFYEEMAINEAIREDEEEDSDSGISVKGEPALPRTRNRPKREV